MERTPWQALPPIYSFGISLETAITAVTAAPAKAVGLDGEIRTIVVGKQADLLLLTPDLTLDTAYINGCQVI